MTSDIAARPKLNTVESLVDFTPDDCSELWEEEKDESLEDEIAEDDAAETRSVRSSRSNRTRTEFVSRDTLELLMREQDADILESIHASGDCVDGSNTGVSALHASPSHNRTISRMSLLLSSEEQQVVEQLIEKSPSFRLNKGSISALSENGDAFNSSSDNIFHDLEAVRKALSGELWVQQDYDNNSERPMYGDIDGMSEFAGIEEEPFPIEESVPSKVEEEETASRRKREAAQFAEAVGELRPCEQDDLRIIEEEVDDDDDDDDAAEVHVSLKSYKGTSPLKQIEPTTSISVDTISPPTKSRFPWPFGGTRATIKRIFLDKLPEGSAAQDFVYKGIQSNPPEIVKSGTSRGNYAQLHRKAWLEVSDKYHRYGKNLRLYYRHWESLGCPANMFFDWLDSKGEAAGQPLPELEECPRAKLDSDTVLYISNPDVTSGYAMRFVPDDMGRGLVLDVDNDPVRTGPDGWMFVLRDGIMYGAQKITTVSGQSKQRFHHSSFFGGKAVAAAGIFLTDDDGLLTRVYPHSGHYRPGEADMQRVLFYLHHKGVDLRTFEVDMQQILHVARDGESQIQDKSAKSDEKVEKKKKVESLQLVPAVLAACFLAHKARFIGEGIFSRLHKIRKADVASVSEALALINSSDTP
jgi:hypothetical protein